MLYSEVDALISISKAGGNGKVFKDVIQEVEKYVLSNVMDSVRYNQTKASKILGISRTSLRTKLKQYFGNKYVGGDLSTL